MKTLALLLGSLVLALGVSVAQDTAPATTNPAERIVYRGDLTMEQQYADQLVCVNWSSEQTDWDPAQAYAALEREHGGALRQYHLAGLAKGAIAGNAGTGAAMGAMGAMAGGAAGGMQGRQGREAAQEAFEAAVDEFSDSFRLWDRHWVACMIGNGYGVG